MATGNMYRKCFEVQACSFWVMWVDRQTYRHADCSVCTALGSEV